MLNLKCLQILLGLPQNLDLFFTTSMPHNTTGMNIAAIANPRTNARIPKMSMKGRNKMQNFSHQTQG